MSRTAGPPEKQLSTLRASCDSCYRAKIRCVFDCGSTCIRCRTQNRHCHRSAVSRPGRKPSRNTSLNSDASEINDMTAVEVDSIMDDVVGNFGTFAPGDWNTTSPDIGKWQCTSWSHDLSEMERLDSSPDEMCSDPSYGLAVYRAPFSDGTESTTESSMAACSCATAIMTQMTELQHAVERDTRLDKILNHHKRAVATVHSVLDCKLHHRHPVINLLFLFLHSTLASYRRIPRQRKGVHSQPSPAATLVDDPNADVIQLGEYTIEEEDSDTVKMQILQLNIGKLGSAIEKAVGWAKQRDDGADSKLYDFLSGFFTAETATISRHVLEP